MSTLPRKLIICAAVDGLIIQPQSSKGQKPLQPVKIQYGNASITTVPREQIPESSSDDSFEAFGVFGLISVSRLNFLVTVTRRQQVATVFGYPIYVVTDVAVTPCSSQADAAESIAKTAELLRKKAPAPLNEESESSDGEVELPSSAVDEVEDAVVSEAEVPPRHARSSSFAEDVMRRRGTYGRFAQRWFSRSGWKQDQKRTMAMSSSYEPTAPASNTDASASVHKISIEEEQRPVQVSTLLPKLLRMVQVLFGSSQSFYFSYDVDITRRMAKWSDAPQSDTPLFAQVDSIFFWNRNIIQPFMSAGQEALVLPLMQGFVGQRRFVVDSAPPQKDGAAGSLEMCSLSPSGSLPSSPPTEKARESVELRPSERAYLLTVVSRRSTKRAGLRYLRRGIDSDGFTANMVETEQILSPSTWDKASKLHSFVQIRGSIPLYFTQSPYSLKPVPTLQHSNETNYQACRTHLERLARTYGELQIVNLVEQHGIEEPIGTRYQRCVSRFDDEVAEDKQKVPFEWFDFHQACRGMKFENVSYLLARLKDKLETFGSTVRQDGVVVNEQRGVLRTNCMDCLDRTNVCQSSFAKHMLEVQLKEEGIDMSAQFDQETSWFNTLWADNGDAVSKQYASTAAMKGDYTRTRKRDYRGALNDFGFAVARFYSGMVNDYFSQAAIDFLLGNVSAKVFDEFEADMMTKDPAVSMTKMREQAVDLCHRRVVADEKEEFHGGWVLISPSSADTVKSWPMEEVVLLLTDEALYLCRFDWNMDKVSSFERIHLANTISIKFGTYITSTISPGHTDELRNVGFVVSYQPGKSDIRRTNTRTISSGQSIVSQSSDKDEKDATRASSLASLLSGRPRPSVVRKLAFKAPYMGSSTSATDTGPQQTEIQQVVTICAEIERLVLEQDPHRDQADSSSLIEKGDIISLDEARRSTGLLEQLGYSIKRLVWA